MLAQFAAQDAILFSAMWIPAAILLPILASAWLHVLIEAPIMNWRRRLSIRDRTPAVAMRF